MERITYQKSVISGQPMPLTKEIWDSLIDSPAVKNICARIASLDASAADYAERKQALKKRLPVIIPHASSFKNGKRVSADATPSGLAMLDVDHVEEPRAWFETIDKQVLSDNRIYLVAITASGKGLRVIGERLPVTGDGLPESIEAAQMRMAEALGIKEYDAVTKDLARASYVVPRDYILWIYEAGLLESPENLDRYAVPGETVVYTVSTVGRKDSALKVPSTEHRLALPAHKEDCDSLVAAGDEGFCYREIPYSKIVEQLMLSIGAAEGAVQGERNTVYFSLATYMRYICDFKAELLLQVLPDFGLSEAERRQAISSAIGRPRKSQIPMILQGAIAVCEREMANQKSQIANQKSTDLALPAMPRLLRLLCRRLPADYQPAMIVASLPILGALATDIRFDYLDRQEQSLSFFSCITAPAASGKSFIRKPLDLLLTPINEKDAIEREKEQAYREKLRASKNSKNQPEDPHACPRNNGIAISIAKLLQLLTYAEGKHLIGIGEEIDTLIKTERAGVWSQKSDIYRMAFDNSTYGQAYMSEASFNAHVKVYYNLLLTGTPNALRRFFKDPEDGLITRVCFAQLPDTSFKSLPVFASYTEAEQAEIIRWARQLDAEHGKIVCPQLNKVIEAWGESKRQQAIEADSYSLDMLRRRAAVIGFRAGMLCYLLENRKYNKTVGSFATWVAEYVLRNQMELFSSQVEQTFSKSIEAQTERGAAASLLSLLPDEFTAADLIKLRARKGQSVKSSAISMVLNRWRANNRIEKASESTWRKI